MFMGMKMTVPTKTVRYTKEQLERWKNGDREECPEGYCKNLPGTYGFGEFIVGQHFARQGYLWIHHDFNIFGGNKPGKYPEAENVLLNCLGRDRFEKVRTLYPTFRLEEPDLLIYTPDFSELRFAEADRKSVV